MTVILENNKITYKIKLCYNEDQSTKQLFVKNWYITEVKVLICRTYPCSRQFFQYIIKIYISQQQNMLYSVQNIYFQNTIYS